MEEKKRLMFDKIRVCVETDLYNSLFLLWRDNNYRIDGDEVIDALNSIRKACDDMEYNLIKK